MRDAKPARTPAAVTPARSSARVQAPFGNQAMLRQLASRPSMSSVIDKPGAHLPEPVRERMEHAFGQDLSSVRVHTDADAADAVDAMGARAATVGPHIAFGTKTYDPDHRRGELLLAHELAHVIQQRGATSSGPLLAGGVATDSTELEADRAAAAVVSGARVPPLSSVPRGVQRQTIDVEIVGHVTQNAYGGEVHRVGDNAGPDILMDLEIGVGGVVTYRWFNFEAGIPVTGGAADWSFLFGVASVFGRSDSFRDLGRRLSAAEWRHLWPNPIPELLRRYEAGTLAIADPAVLSAYRGLVRATARTQLDENEHQVDELLGATDRVARLQEYADGLREASVTRDHLEARRGELQHSLVQQQSFTLGLAGNVINMNPAQRMRGMMDLASVEDSIAGWYTAFPLLTRLRTTEINAARVEDTLRTIKANIIATRPRLDPNGHLDPMELENTRTRVEGTMGPRAIGVVAAEDSSRRRARIAGGIAQAVGMIALLFLPGGVFIDAAIGVAIAADSWSEAAVIGQAANTGLHVDDGLMAQAQANAARWHAILSTIFAILGPAMSVGFRVLRVARAFVNVRRVLPELEVAQHMRLARALADNPAMMRVLTRPATEADAFVLSRIRSAVRDLGTNPAALRRSLEVTGALARIPRRIVESDAYSPIRAITDGSDLDAIARLTGLTREEVAAARQHFMLDEHILVHEAGGLHRGRFVADPGDASMWLRAAQGRRLAADEISQLRRLIRHEVGEAAALAGQRRTIEEAFVNGELEGMLQRLLRRHLDPARVRAIMEHETRPIMPFRYAHYFAHFNGAPNP